MKAKELAFLAVRVYGALQKEQEFEDLMNLCLESNHEVVLEIGSGRGGTLWAWSHLPSNRCVISVDLPGGSFGGGLNDEDKERIQNWIDRDKDTFLIAGDSHSDEIKSEVFEALTSIGKEYVDILMIDGDHSYDGVKKDFQMYSQLVKPGGLIVFHDICDHSTTAPTCQVDRFWNELKADSSLDTLEFISEPKTWGGIGVIKCK